MFLNRILSILATVIVVFIIGCAEDSPSGAQTKHTGQYKITKYTRDNDSINEVNADTLMLLDVADGVFTKYTQKDSTVTATTLEGVIDIWVSGNDMILDYKEKSNSVIREKYTGIKTTFTVPPTSLN